MPKVICDLCNRGEQESKKWGCPRCVCCDVHESRCRHKHIELKRKNRLPDTNLWPLENQFTHEVERMPVSKQVELFFLKDKSWGIFNKSGWWKR